MAAKLFVEIVEKITEVVEFIAGSVVGSYIGPIRRGKMESRNKYSRVIELEELKGYKDVRSIEIPCFTREAAIKEYGKTILVNKKEYFVKEIEKRGSFHWLILVKADMEGQNDIL